MTTKAAIAMRRYVPDMRLEDVRVTTWGNRIDAMAWQRGTTKAGEVFELVFIVRNGRIAEQLAYVDKATRERTLKLVETAQKAPLTTAEIAAEVRAAYVESPEKARELINELASRAPSPPAADRHRQYRVERNRSGRRLSGQGTA